MLVSEVFNSKDIIETYRERFFYPPDMLRFKTGLQKPVLFISDKDALKVADHFSVQTISDAHFEAYVISCGNSLLMFFIDIKVPFFTIAANGIIMKNRATSTESDRKGVRVKYSFDHFHVVTNELNTCTIFARDVTAEPTT